MPEEKEINPSETVEGGRYLVNDVLVNAEGQPIEDKAKKEKAEKEEPKK